MTSRRPSPSTVTEGRDEDQPLHPAEPTAAGCLVLHVVFLVAGGRGMRSLSVPMLALSLACAVFATYARTRRAGAQAALRATSACGAAMVAGHL